MTIGDILNEDLVTKKWNRFYLRTNSEIKFPNKWPKIDPYLMGQMLGDGTMGRGAFQISTGDIETIEKLTHILGDDYVLSPRGNKGIDFRLKYNSNGNPLLNLFREYGVNLGSLEKYIPNDYLFGSIEDRIMIMRGLMDSDGTCRPNGTNYSFCTISTRLRDNMVFLGRSLGGTPSVGFKKPFYIKDGIKIRGQDAYNVSLKLPNHICPFDLSRKKERWEQKFKSKAKYTPYLIFESIAPIGIGYHTTLVTQNGSYIVEDFVNLIG